MSNEQLDDKKIRIVGLAASNVLLGWSGAKSTINYCENYIKLIEDKEN